MSTGPISKGVRSDSALLELASLYGIQSTYMDSSGQRQAASEEAVRAALRALGAREGNPVRAIQARRAEIESRLLEPVQLAWDGKLKDIKVRLPRRSPLLGPTSRWQVSLTQEGGGHSAHFCDGKDITISADSGLSNTVIVTLPLGLRMNAGYHQLRLEASSGRRVATGEATVISAPVQCYSPDAQPRRSWGAFLPLYALRSRGDWGTGDFAALGRMHQWVRELGGAWTGTLPLLATFLDRPCEPSPYMPVSRLFWNELYIAPQLEPEFAQSSEARRALGSAAWQRSLRAAYSSNLVQYREAMRLKRRVIAAMASHLMRTAGARQEEFRRYVAAHPMLTDYARFRAVQEARDQNWFEWPERMKTGPLREADGAAGSEIYHQYVQWIAEQQLTRISSTAASGGLYLDFPLGVHPQGYDVWRHQSLFARGASAGAPPDDLFPDGQNWGFPPLLPEAMRHDGYRYFRDCLRHQMRHAGLLRIDHLMSFNRLYWIPEGIAKRDGVYVQYRSEELYAVLNLESHRAQTVVVGENLGTVPESVDRAMKRHRALGMHILQFGVSADRSRPLTSPGARNVASLNTHDTPPFAGYLQGCDISDFERLGVYSSLRGRQKRHDRQALVAALSAHFGLRGSRASEAQRRLLRHCLRWLADSPAEIVMVNLEDLWLELRPQNIPGTGAGTSHPDEPNWQRRARLSWELLLRRKDLRRLLQGVFRGRNAQARRHV